jgi:hypothetical protein
MKKTIFGFLPIILFAVLFCSCEALKKNICGEGKYYDTVTVLKYSYDTVTAYDTIAYVSIERRDTIPIFRGTAIFIGSTSDSVNTMDSMRYLSFEIMNYGENDYVPTETAYLNLIFDLEINNLIVYSDTGKIDQINSGLLRKYTFKYPANKFLSRGIVQPYHYRITIADQNFKIKDMFFPRPIINVMPVKQYDEIIKDTVIYWIRPNIKDTIINVTRKGYAYKDSLLFIDDIVGCLIYSHYFNGNKFYNFTLDTCLNILCSNDITDNNTPAISGMIVTAWPMADTARLKIYVNDSLIDNTLKSGDSAFVFLIRKSFSDIDSITFESNCEWIFSKALLNKMDLLNNPTIKVNGLTNDNGVYKIVKKVPVNPLIAYWKFDGNGNDVNGKYPAIVMHPEYQYETVSSLNGSKYLSTNNSEAYANAGVIPLQNKFTISFYFKTSNENSTTRPILGISKVNYPNGYILYMDEIKKSITFATGDGTSQSRLITNDGVWAKSQWNHVVITGDKDSGTGEIYINKVKQTMVSSTGIFKTFRTDLPLLIGRSADLSQMWGYLEELRIYNKILITGEINNL